MSLLRAGIVLVAVNVATIAAMLLVRRRAPEGSYFTDGDRASGVFGVLATASASASSSSRRSGPGSPPGRGRIGMRRCRRSPCRSTGSRRPRRPTASRRGAAASSERAGIFIQRADNYSLAVVLFAASLFFAGISTRLHSSTTRMVVLGLGYALFLGCLIWIATFPVSLSV